MNIPKTAHQIIAREAADKIQSLIPSMDNVTPSSYNLLGLAICNAAVLKDKDNTFYNIILNATERILADAEGNAYGRGVTAGKLEALQYTPEERERYGKWSGGISVADAVAPLVAALEAFCSLRASIAINCPNKMAREIWMKVCDTGDAALAGATTEGKWIEDENGKLDWHTTAEGNLSGGDATHVRAPSTVQTPKAQGGITPPSQSFKGIPREAEKPEIFTKGFWNAGQ